MSKNSNTVKPKICWVTPDKEVYGNALGYATHNRNMIKYSKKYMDFDYDALAALTITPADHFEPVPGKFNILFSMFEFVDLPKTYVANLHKADAIVVPCSFCRDLFKKYTDIPIEVCWEGVEPEKYPFYQRSFPKIKQGEKFRFLWIGAPNPRKGYPLVLEAIKLFENVPEVEIYIKTTTEKTSVKKFLKTLWRRRREIFRGKEAEREKKAFWGTLRRLPRPSLAGKVRKFGKLKNIIFDTRFLPHEELLDLYNSAHCFILPSFGEGWGLTLCEALATGAPCIAPKHTGTADFFDEEVGFTIKHELIEQTLKNYDLKTRGYVCDTQDMVSLMLTVMKHYNEALRRGKRGSERIKNKFTWDKSAKRLTELVARWTNVNNQ